MTDFSNFELRDLRATPPGDIATMDQTLAAVNQSVTGLATVYRQYLDNDPEAVPGVTVPPSIAAYLDEISPAQTTAMFLVAISRLAQLINWDAG